MVVHIKWDDIKKGKKKSRQNIKNSFAIVKSKNWWISLQREEMGAPKVGTLQIRLDCALVSVRN